MKDNILSEIEDCIERFDTMGLAMNVEILLTLTDEEDASKELSLILFKSYTSYKEEGTAQLMETIIRVNPQLALLKFPENYLFRLAVLKGSIELYECYLEEAIEPFLTDKTEDEVFECYSELYAIAEKMNEAFFTKYVKCIKGLDFNGAVNHNEANSGPLLIHKEDFDVMNDAIEKYNTIVGRRDILADLTKRI
ncbi:hypothetical protein SAMN05421813_13711 [Daejeonella rubra]|uniref:Uncharacterized protein n=1 Tax=Daejeonella rubra TaxID=990371 RepID=A0A1G9YAZ1_9SPHI|nr:hypothetical protein [Daejeonella rubra]SDN06274.1 hypothetical protein SAMN05421813_13711 [Daejeonella rubra]